MALTRKFLEGMGLTEEQVEQIIKEHATTADALTRALATNKSMTEELESAKTELETVKQTAKDTEKAAKDWQGKFEKANKDFDMFKKDIENKETHAKVQGAYAKLLKDAGIGEKHISAICGVTKFDDLVLNDKGEFDNADDLKKDIDDKWGGFKVETIVNGAKVDNPPTGGKTEYTSKAEIMAIKDTTERQAAIMANPSLFGK